MAEPSNEQQPRSVSPVSSPPARRYGIATAALVLAVAAATLTGWHWYETERALQALQHDVAKRLADVGALGRDARSLADQSRDAVRDVEVRLGQLEARMVETQNQRLALESLYQDLSRGRDEWTLAEVEQVLLLASQQLQLAGNVKAALIAMETADARLARMDRPHLVALRRVINRDIERLRGVPHVDVVGMALSLDTVASRIESLPLTMEARPAASAPEPERPEGGIWKRLWREFAGDLRDLVRIQRTDTSEVPLLSPEQAFFLRENLRIRLLGARLALLSRDEASFRADLKDASDWLARYFDVGDKSVAAAQSALSQLARAQVSIQLPDVSASLDAARTLKLARERTLR